MKKIKKRSDCPISHTLDLLGDRWTLLILRDAIFRGYRFYKEFLEEEEKIATNILSDRLKMLEAEGFMTSRKYEKQKTKKLYLLTEKGISVLPIILEMLVWGYENDENTTMLVPEIIDRVKADRAGLIKEIEESVRSFDSKNFC